MSRVKNLEDAKPRDMIQVPAGWNGFCQKCQKGVSTTGKEGRAQVVQAEQPTKTRAGRLGVRVRCSKCLDATVLFIQPQQRS